MDEDTRRYLIYRIWLYQQFQRKGFIYHVYKDEYKRQDKLRNNKLPL